MDGALLIRALVSNFLITYISQLHFLNFICIGSCLFLCMCFCCPHSSMVCHKLLGIVTKKE